MASTLSLVARERIQRQGLTHPGKFRVGGHQPCATLQGEFRGKGIGIAQVVFLFEGSGASGAVDVDWDDRDRQVPQF